MCVASSLYERIAAFQLHIPLITALRNPGLRDRHWAQMTSRIGFPVKADASFSVTRALHLELQKHLATIEEARTRPTSPLPLPWCLRVLVAVRSRQSEDLRVEGLNTRHGVSNPEFELSARCV